LLDRLVWPFFFLLDVPWPPAIPERTRNTPFNAEPSPVEYETTPHPFTRREMFHVEQS
jgi:hypothetical protein